ncbi:MAG TPA: hypothetical protein VEU29_03355 [Actinomycetota bacterium]|nr:hypothetical protein [Actinomycetota bacterium]
MKRSNRLVMFTAAVAAFSMVGIGSAVAVDPWYDSGSVVNSLVGPKACSISGTQPARSGSLVTASGSVNCTRVLDEVEVKVCIQVRQAFVAETVTWVDHVCGGNVRQAAANVSATTSGPCLVGTWSYRTVVTGGGYALEEKPWTGVWVSSPPTTLTCEVI